MIDMDHARKYWQYEYDVTARYMIPLLEHWGVRVIGARILDIGCGEGGGLSSMHDHGARCHGFDIDEYRIEMFHALQGERAMEVTTGSIYSDHPPFSGKTFDLVVLHDVFEHLERKDDALHAIREYLADGGKVLITFPPYFSAYGAHQQRLHTSFARIPFFHLLPFSISYLLPRLKGEPAGMMHEVQKLARLKMGMRKFEQLVRSASFSIEGKRAYLISPNHIRFGLRPISAGPIANIPLVNEIFCSGAAYLLS